MIQKVFAFLVRNQGPGNHELLVLEDQRGNLSVPKGTVETGEPLPDAALRELAEESGIGDARIVALLGQHWVRIHGGPDMRGPLEDQHHTGFLIAGIHPEDFRETWGHRVNAPGVENGQIFRYRWIRPTTELPLIYGAERFIPSLLLTLKKESDGTQTDAE